MQWKLFYADGSTYSDADGPPDLAPGRGVQVAIQANIEIGREILHGHDYYYWRDGQWWGNDDKSSYALWDYLSEPGLKVVKFGRIMRREDFFVICKRAMDDPYLPVKTARLPRERPEPTP
jgi:hypothetical protein